MRYVFNNQFVRVFKCLKICAFLLGYFFKHFFQSFFTSFNLFHSVIPVPPLAEGNLIPCTSAFRGSSISFR